MSCILICLDSESLKYGGQNGIENLPLQLNVANTLIGWLLFATGLPEICGTWLPL